MLIKWNNTIELEYKREELEDRRAEIESDISDLDVELIDGAERLDLLDEIINDNRTLTDNDDINRLIRILLRNSDEREEWVDEHSDRNDRMDRLNESLERVDREIRDLCFRINEMASDTTTIDIDKITEQLNRNKKITSIKAEDNCVTITIADLHMTPIENNWGATVELVKPIPLGEITLVIEPGRPLTIFTADKDKNAVSMSRSVAHPHILGENHPCLGDFESLITEAVIDGDIVSAVGLTISYLETCNPKDYAGQNWINWVMRDMPKSFYADIGAHKIYKECLHPEHNKENQPVMIRYAGPDDIQWAFIWENKWYDATFTPDYADEIEAFEIREREKQEKAEARIRKIKQAKDKKTDLILRMLLNEIPRPLQHLTRAEASFT